MARPASNEPAAIQIAIRVSPSLKEVLVELAEKDRRNLSDYCRNVLVDALISKGVANVPTK